MANALLSKGAIARKGVKPFGKSKAAPSVKSYGKVGKPTFMKIAQEAVKKRRPGPIL